MSKNPASCVRPFRSSDLDQVARLFDAYRQFNGQPSGIAEGRAFLQRRIERGESIMFVAEPQAGQLAGFTQLYPTFSSVSLARVFIVNDLYVDPSVRRGGLGGALLRAAAAYAREHGAVRMSANTAHENVATQILNELVGFKRDSEFIAYHMRTCGESGPRIV
jgi:L-amino acid N-acyltransferase YncA